MNIISAIKTRLVIIVPYIWLLFFFLLPFLLVLKIALSDLEYGQPPYAAMSLSDGWSGFWDKLSMLDFENFTFLIGDRSTSSPIFPACRSPSSRPCSRC
jgi:putrescine transport system permease protein